MALPPKEPGYFPDNKILRSDAVLSAQSQIIFCGHKRSEIKTAKNARVLLRLTDASSQVLPGHRLRNHDKMSREFSGMTLRRAKKCIWQQILKATKGRPVNCVYDDWHTGSMSSNATQESSLSAVRMDNIRPPLTENGGELLQRNPILQRPNGAHEFRHD